jgi:hypothetical protein
MNLLRGELHSDQSLRELVQNSQKIVVISSAGISVNASGMFRQAWLPFLDKRYQ